MKTNKEPWANKEKLEHFTQITNFANQSELIAANKDIHQQGEQIMAKEMNKHFCLMKSNIKALLLFL